MEKLIRLKTGTFILIYIIADLICIGAGMGVPIFCILLGFPLGWYITRRNSQPDENSRSLYAGIFKSSILTSAFTFASMTIIWGIGVLMYVNSSSDINAFGHPFILYDPKASFIAWLVLMIIISPFLQLLTTIFASFLTLMKVETEHRNDA